jgi:hypothetical protein
MSNITLSVDDTVIRKVRRIAVDKNTTLTAMVRDYLSSVAAQDAATRDQGANELRESFGRYSVDMGQHTWTREELHER